MKYFDWDEAKNEWLKLKRGYGFDEIYQAIAEGNLLADIPHPNQSRYPNQKIFIIESNNYALAAPYVEDDQKIFLKTIYPSRKFTKIYLERAK